MADFVKIAFAGIIDTIIGIILAAFYPVFSALGHPEFVIILFIIFTVIPIMTIYSKLLKMDFDNPSQFLQILFTLIVSLGTIQGLV